MAIMYLLFTVINAFIFVCFANVSLPRIKTAPHEGGYRVLVDESGREIYLHGVNAIVKGPPWLPVHDVFDVDVSLNAEDLNTLALLGVTVIRLGMMWPGVEPVRGQYNETYLRIQKEIVESAAQYGIYTILDMHQDLFSEKTCGEGIPLWASKPSGIFKMPMPVEFEAWTDTDSMGLPTRQDCSKHSWPTYQFAEATASSYQSLYDNDDGFLDAWEAFWSKVATTFKGVDSVLGFELINEPWAGNMFHNPLLMLPGVGDRENLSPAYDILAKSIHAIDPDRLIFFAGVTWDDFSVGFDHVPAGLVNNSVLSYHYYEPPQFEHSEESYLSIRKRDAARLGCAFMLTEFEGMNPSLPHEVNGSDWERTVTAAETIGQSWAWWEYKTFCKETLHTLSGKSQWADYGSCKTGYGQEMIYNAAGELNVTMAARTARTYAIYVAGTMTHTYLDVSTRVFSLSYVVTLETLKLDTDIYLMEKWSYPRGFIISIVGPAMWEKANINRIRIKASANAAGKMISVTIKPK